MESPPPIETPGKDPVGPKPSNLVLVLILLISFNQAVIFFLIYKILNPGGSQGPASAASSVFQNQMSVSAVQNRAETPATHSIPSAPSENPPEAEERTITLTDSFEDDFAAGKNIPNLADPKLSSSFSAINEKRPGASGRLTLRDRDVTDPSGVGGGFRPKGPVSLDFSDGMGKFVTFHFKAPEGARIAKGSYVVFDVTAFGGDGGHLFKSVSSDGLSFLPVGDDSSDNGHYEFQLPPGGAEAYLRLQTGTTAGIFEGVWIGHVSAKLNLL